MMIGKRGTPNDMRMSKLIPGSAAWVKMVHLCRSAPRAVRCVLQAIRPHVRRPRHRSSSEDTRGPRKPDRLAKPRHVHGRSGSAVA